MSIRPEVHAVRHRAPDLSAARVSVVIPAYNARAYLPQAIESALDQTLPPAEVIVVDDGSTDGTSDVLAPYLGRIRCLRQSNLGVSAARNAGFAAATGEFMAFLDADDYFLPGKLASQVELLRSHPALAFVNSGWHVVDAQGHLLKELEPWREAPKLDLLTWLQWKPVFPGALLFRRDALARVGGFDPKLKHAEDVDLVLRMARLGCQAEWSRQPSVCYRQHAGNTTRAKVDQAAGIVAVLASFFEGPGLPRPVRKKEAAVWYSTLLWAAWELFSVGRPDDAQHYLRQSLTYAKAGRENAALGWAGTFARFARREGRGVPPTAAISLFLNASGADGARSPALATALRFRLEVVEPYVADGDLPDAKALRGYRGLTARQVIKTTQGALASSPRAIRPSRVARFWERLVGSGLVGRSNSHEVTTLYLTLFARTAFALEWPAAVDAGWHALRGGAHPRALPAWGRFFRAALLFLVRRPSGDFAEEIWARADRDGQQDTAGPP